MALVSAGKYSVRKDGSIINTETGRMRGALRGEYKMVSFSYKKKQYSILAHRVVYRFFHGTIPDGYEVNHKNGDKTDNAPNNLEAVTASENQKHAFRLGLKKAPAGEYNYAAKFTDRDVSVLRSDFANGLLSVREICRRYGVSRPTAYSMLKGKTYRNVPVCPSG